jgi:hypothetical protein
MGWLFAVALGLHRKSRAVVLISLIPIALGHALAVGTVALVLVLLGGMIDQRALRIVSGVVLIGWAIYHRLWGARHRVRVGMRTGMAGLALWSFMMAGAHGAGLMLVPVLFPHGAVGSPSSHAAHHEPLGGSVPLVIAAVGVHSLAMLAVTGAVAIVVYQWVGLAFLRRGWINLDLVWTAALLATGLILLL